MGNPFRATTNTTGIVGPFNADWTLTPPNLAYAAVIQTGTCTYSVQYTLDDLNDPAITTATWFNDTFAPANTSTSANGNYTFPIRFLRANVTAISGTFAFTVLQGFPP